MTRWKVVFLVGFLLTAAMAHADFTFVQISDTHVGVKQAAYNARYAEVIRQVNALKPAFVVHTGDALERWSPESAALLKDISAKLAAPIYIAPGNHDITKGKVEALSAWNGAFGYDRVSFQHERCVLIGLNSNLFNTGLPAEREQFEWLKSELKKAKGKRIFIFQHCPLFLEKPSDPNGNYFAVDEPARSELLKLLKANHVEAVLTGHYHRFNDSAFDGISFFTTPATSFSCSPDKGLTGYSVFHLSPGGFTRRFVDLRTGGSPPDFQP